MLSPSTQAYDRGGKLVAYRQIASVRDILLVWSIARRIEHWTRGVSDWTVRDIGGGSVSIDHLGVTIDLAAIYEGIDEIT